METEATEKQAKPALVFPSKAREELYWAGKQFIKTLTILIVLAIVLYLTHFFSMPLTFLLGIIGFILLLATITYSIGHLVRYMIFSARGQ